MRPVHRDIIVLGAGPAGVAAVSALLESRQSVSLISHENRAVSCCGCIDNATISPRFGKISPKVLNVIGVSNLAAYVETNRLYARDFTITGQLRDGGLLNAWGAVSPRWSEAELAGFGEAKDQIKRQYDVIAPINSLFSEIGVTERWRRALSCSAQSAHDSLGLSPNMIDFGNSHGSLGFLGECRLCGDCHQGCRYGAIYDAQFHLDNLQRDRLFERLSTGEVNKIEVNNEGKALITCKECDGTRRLFSANRVIVALGTLASTRLLASLLPETLQPKSVQTTPSFAVPLIDKRLFAGAEMPTFALSQAVFDLGERDGSSAAYGSIYSSRTIPISHLLGQSSLAKIIAVTGIAKPLLRQMDIALGFLPGRYSKNTLEFDMYYEHEDPLKMTIVGDADETLSNLVTQSIVRLKTLLSPTGIGPIMHLTRLLPAGADTHYGASLRPGVQTTLSGALVNQPAIYCVDGAVLPDLPAKHLTLTIMANARRIAHDLVMRGN